MRRLSLSIATVTCMLAVPVLLVSGMDIFSAAPIMSLMMIFVGIPMCIANAVVFDYVKRKRDLEHIPTTTHSISRSDQRPVDASSVTKGTPWENDPGHTNQE